MTTWILIFGMHAGLMASNDFSSTASAEFTSKEKCEIAAQKFKDNFDTMKDVKAKAFCVEK